MLTNTASFWRIQMADGKALCFTDSDINIKYEEETYICGSNFTPNAIASSNELAQDNFTIAGIIDGELISKESLMSGDFSQAYFEFFIIKNKEKLILKTGWLGDIKFDNNKFTASVNSLSSKTNNLIGKCYSSSCRAEFGDLYCKINKENYKLSGEVTALVEDYSFIDSSRIEPDDYFTQGILEFISGANKGRSYNISSFYDNKITIDSIFNQKIKIGDKYTITAGCNKSLYVCINKFSNAINFRGEPFIPSRHKLLACN